MKFLEWIEKRIMESNLNGEYWISDDGNAWYADGDVGDVNHEGYVIGMVIGKLASDLGVHNYESEFGDWEDVVRQATEEYIDEHQELFPEEDGDPDLSEVFDNYLAPKLDQKALAIAQGYGDARVYAMEEWGWKTLRSNYVETWTLNQDDFASIASGISDAYHELDQDDEEQLFSIYVYTTKKSQEYTYKEIEAAAKGQQAQLSTPPQTMLNKTISHDDYNMALKNSIRDREIQSVDSAYRNKTFPTSETTKSKSFYEWSIIEGPLPSWMDSPNLSPEMKTLRAKTQNAQVNANTNAFSVPLPSQPPSPSNTSPKIGTHVRIDSRTGKEYVMDTFAIKFAPEAKIAVGDHWAELPDGINPDPNKYETRLNKGQWYIRRKTNQYTSTKYGTYGNNNTHTGVLRNLIQHEPFQEDGEIKRGVGWKLHLPINDAKNGDIVEKLLKQMGLEEMTVSKQYIGVYKRLHGGGESDGKTFTVYIGHKDDAQRVANHIARIAGRYLEPTQVEADYEMAPRVWARFDSQMSSHGREYKSYGHLGHPTASDASFSWDGKRGGNSILPLDKLRELGRKKAGKHFGDLYTGTGQS